jgi:hypothetical protein
LKIEDGLQVHPERWGGPEVPRQPQRGIRRYCAAFAHDVIDAQRVNLELQGQGVP